MKGWAPVAVHTVVVVGSSESLPEHTQAYFWVIDFSNAPTGVPTAVSVPCSSNGVVVDCSGSLAAVAAVTGGSVTIYDISTPAAPQENGSAALPFNNIGAISFYGDYVLVGQAQASTHHGAQVALIDVNNLASPKIYGTTFATITDVTLFGEVAVICGLAVYSNAFQVAKTSDFHHLATTVAMNNFSAWSENTVPFMCDFDGTNAIFSDGLGVSVIKVSGGAPTSVGSPSTIVTGKVTSVAIAESGGASSVPNGGVQLAYTGVDDAHAELFHIVPPVPPGSNWPSGRASLGDPNNIYGQPNATYGGVAKFYRSIYGTSTQLATAGVTQTTAGAQEYVVSLFNVSAGAGSISATRQGPRYSVPFDTTLSQTTLGITVFYTLWPIPWPIPGPWRGSR
jgi:hypothetical protein